MILNARDPATVILIREAELIIRYFDFEKVGEMDLEDYAVLHAMRRRLIGDVGETYRRQLEHEMKRKMSEGVPAC